MSIDHPVTGHARSREEVVVWLYSLFKLCARRWCVVKATPRLLYPSKWLGTHWTGVGVGLRAGLGVVRKISHPPGFDSRTVHTVGSRYTDWTITAHDSGHFTLNPPLKKKSSRSIFYIVFTINQICLKCALDFRLFSDKTLYIFLVL